MRKRDKINTIKVFLEVKAEQLKDKACINDLECNSKCSAKMKQKN